MVLLMVVLMECCAVLRELSLASRDSLSPRKELASPPWPPSEEVLAVFTFLFRNGTSIYALCWAYYMHLWGCCVTFHTS